MRRSNSPKKKSRLRAECKDRPDLFMPGPFGMFAAIKAGPFPAAESAEGDRDAAAVPARLVQMGDEKYLVSFARI